MEFRFRFIFSTTIFSYRYQKTNSIILTGFYHKLFEVNYKQVLKVITPVYQDLGPCKVLATSGTTKVGHYFWYFGPSIVHVTSRAT